MENDENGTSDSQRKTKKSYKAYRMVSIRYPSPLVTLKVIFAVWKFIIPMPRKILIVWFVYTSIGERTWLVISIRLSYWNWKNLPRSLAVTYTVKIVISRKRYKTETLLDYYYWLLVGSDTVYHNITAIRRTWVNCKVIHLLQTFSNRIFRIGVQQLTRFWLI